MDDGLLILAVLCFVGGQLVAAASDAWRMRIPNGLIGVLLAAYVGVAVLAQPDWAALAAHAAVGAALFAGGVVLFARGWMGGGDVKLLAVTGLWFGPAFTPGFLVLTALAGGLLTLAVIVCRRVPAAHRLAGGRIAALHDPLGRVPYGIAIAAAAIAIVSLQPGALLTS